LKYKAPNIKLLNPCRLGLFKKLGDEYLKLGLFKLGRRNSTKVFFSDFSLLSMLLFCVNVQNTQCGQTNKKINKMQDGRQGR
jgi:hypothetical protein